jgi:hypothetical protein
MATNVYVDAFNLYYGSLKGTPYRWLDLGALCSCTSPTRAGKQKRDDALSAGLSPANPQGSTRRADPRIRSRGLTGDQLGIPDVTRSSARPIFGTP